MEFDEKELDKLTRLCRIECTEEEKKALQLQIASILGYVQQLNEVDTDGVETCNSVLEMFTSVLRDDTVEDTLSRDVFLANAPSHVGGMIRVPPVIKFTNP